MKELKKYAEEFRNKYESFLTGCDALEEMSLWDKEENGEMDAFYTGDLTSIIIRLISADGDITEKEVNYLNDMFGFVYTEQELTEIYEQCGEEIDTLFDEGIKNGYDVMKSINLKLAEAYKELIMIVCDTVIASDGVIDNIEVALVEKVREMCR